MTTRQDGATSARPIVAITRGDLYGDPAARLSAIAEVRQREAVTAPSQDELAELAAGASGVLGLAGDPVTPALLDRLPDLRVYAVASAGYDSLDVAGAAERGVVICSAPGVLSEAVADTTFGLILGARRRLVEADRYVRAGRWHVAGLQLMVGLDVHGATLGLLGYGPIGRAVARRASGFGMRVICFDPFFREDGLATLVTREELFATSDVLSIHVPLAPQTRGSVGEPELRAMKPTATIVNTSRGGVVDQPALVRALREGWIGSAGLDVQAVEPNPDPADPLLAFDNVVVLPHIASASLSARLAMTDLAARNVEAVLAGGEAVTPVPGSPRAPGRSAQAGGSVR